MQREKCLFFNQLTQDKWHKNLTLDSIWLHHAEENTVKCVTKNKDEMNIIELEKVKNLTKVWRVSAPKEICPRAGQRRSGRCTLQNLTDRSVFPVRDPKLPAQRRRGALTRVPHHVAGWTASGTCAADLMAL